MLFKAKLRERASVLLIRVKVIHCHWPSIIENSVRWLSMYECFRLNDSGLAERENIFLKIMWNFLETTSSFSRNIRSFWFKDHFERHIVKFDDFRLSSDIEKIIANFFFRPWSSVQIKITTFSGFKLVKLCFPQESWTWCREKPISFRNFHGNNKFVHFLENYPNVLKYVFCEKKTTFCLFYKYS